MRRTLAQRPAVGARHAPAGRDGAGRLPLARVLGPREVVMLQRQAGNAAVCHLMRTVVPHEQFVVQRTIDQDARRYAMDWLASRGRPFVQEVTRLGLPRLGTIIDGVLGPAGAAGAPQVLREDRATYTTALAAALVRLGDKTVGQLSARLGDGRPGLEDLLRRLEATVPAQIPSLTLSTPQSEANFLKVQSQLDDPFLVLQLGGARFTFDKAMALHMLRRHHPDYLQGDPMQVQSFFGPGTTIAAIIALIQGSLRSKEAEVRAWRAMRRGKNAAQLSGDDTNVLNLRPFFDGNYWELTLSLPAGSPQAGAGRVEHFTPTL